MRCMECGGKLHKEQGPMEESYKGRKYTIDSVSRYVCESCGEYEIDADEELRVSSILAAKYRQDEGLLTPEQIRSIRVSLGLTQKQFEELIASHLQPQADGKPAQCSSQRRLINSSGCSRRIPR